jgi:linoleoyl-CoA desaturase
MGGYRGSARLGFPMPRFAAQSTYGQVLRARGLAALARDPVGRYADTEQWVRSGVAVVGFVGLYALILVLPPGGVSFALAGLAGVFAYVVIATLCHDASHHSLSRSRSVNQAVVFAGFALAGISGALWARRHLRTHHMFPNVAGTDIDADSTSLVRLTPHVRWRWWHRYQSFYAPLLYLLVLGHLAFVEDFQHLRQARREAPEQFATWRATFEFTASKLIHVLIALVVPLVVIDAPAGNVIAAYLIASGAASAMFVLINVGTHICDVAAFVDPRKDGVIAHDWATHQAMTAVDWSPQSRWAIALTGGANSHAAHHLFPEAAHCHNAKLSRVVAECARAFDKPHHVLTFAGMMASHFNHLRALSRPDGGAPIMRAPLASTECSAS